MICSTTTTSEDLSSNITNLCRICSAPGSHSIFLKIPAYLHEHPRECARWQLPIHRLVTEVTGLDVSHDDGLPQKICVLCISYLKHAYTFRRQAIDNVAALLAAKYLIGVQHLRKEAKGDLTDDLPAVVVNPVVVRANVNEISYKMINLGGGKSRKAISYQKNLDKEVLQQVLGGSIQQKKKQNNAEEERRRIEEALVSRWQDSSPEENATGTAGGFFSYTEKEFEEDDIMELEVLKEHDITFNLPEDYKEKKCPSCRRRFMFDESYNEHLKECLLFKLVKFIREVYHFLFLKENRSISSFEFIRRVVFSVKKTAELIETYDDGNVEPESEAAESSIAKTSVDEETVKIERSFLSNLEKLKLDFNPEGSKTFSPTILQQPQIDDGRSSITTESTSTSPLVAISRCEKCQMTFELAIELEAHNLIYHQGSVTTPNNLKRSAQFPPAPTPPSPKEVEMIKNRLLPRTPEMPNGGSPTGSGDDQRKTVSCKKCQQRFYTITQLDNHQIRSCQRKSPPPQQQQQRQPNPATVRNRKNLNADYFYMMEQLKDMK